MKYRYRLKENIAASPGPGWNSRGANVGTDAVVMPDPEKAAEAWAKSLGRSPGQRERLGWENHAEREGLSPEQIEKGWKHVVKDADKEEASALATLRKVFGERSAWAGYSGHPDGQTLEPDEMGIVRRKRPRTQVQSEGAAFLAVPVMPRPSPATGDGRTKTNDDETPPGFPFHTRSAELVWAQAQKIVRTHPEANLQEILRLSMEAAKVTVNELTPEDAQLLQMAVNQIQNGPARTNARFGNDDGFNGAK